MAPPRQRAPSIASNRENANNSELAARKSLTDGARRRQRVRVSNGIYKDQHGLAAIVEVKGQRKEKRFPRGTALDVIKTWRRTTAATIDQERKDRQSRLLPQDVFAFLKEHATMPSVSARTTLLNHWVKAFGNVSRDDVTGQQIRDQLRIWRLERKWSQSYLRKLCTALSRLYTEFDGRNARNPVRDIDLPREPDPEPRALPYRLAVRLINRVSSDVTQARLRVMLETGLPPAEMMKLEPGDLDLDSAEPSLLMRRRRKGQGRAPIRVPLSPTAVAALKRFRKLKLFGKFDPSNARKVLKTAAKSLIKDKKTTTDEAAALGRMRNYDLRHTFGNEVYAATKNPVLTQKMMGHADLKTTMRYTLAAVGEDLRSVPESVATHLATHRKPKKTCGTS